MTPERLQELRRDAARPSPRTIKASELLELVSMAERLDVATIGNALDRERIDGLETDLREALATLATAKARIADLEARLAERADRITELQQALDHATGPHCSSCGNAIDPDCCWCGSTGPHHRDEGHGFVPMGCDCSRDSADRDWKRCASELRSRLWREKHHAGELEAALEAAEVRITELSEGKP